jgi:hypothetical protein
MVANAMNKNYDVPSGLDFIHDRPQVFEITNDQKYSPERFAQELAKGKTASEAYSLAGYVENLEASRLK